MKRLSLFWSVALGLLFGMGLMAVPGAARAQFQTDEVPELSRDWTIRAGMYIFNSETARATAQLLNAEVPAPLLPRLEEELLLHLSYLADTLGTGQPEIFSQHVAWYQGFWPLREFGDLSFFRLLSALQTVLEGSFPGQDEVKAVLGAASTPKEKKP